MPVKRISVIIFFLSIVSCEKYDLVGIFFGQSPTVDERFSESMKEPQVEEVEAMSDNYRLYVLTDTHVENTTSRLDKYVKNYLEDNAAENFSLFLGDMELEKGKMPVAWEAFQPIISSGRNIFATPGNHDISFGQWEVFKEYFKRSVYLFKVNTPSEGTDLYICLDSAEGTLGSDQREWVEKRLKEASQTSYRNIIIFTHTHFFKKDSSQGHTSNYNLEENFDLLDLFSRYGVDYVLTGHDHHYEKTVFRDVTYYTLNSFSETKSEGSYYIFTMGSTISFEETVLD